ncbi:MAG: hypothetical protein ACE5G2_02350 [Candidatus Krumholzibacteriia bacterium]
MERRAARYDGVSVITEETRRADKMREPLARNRTKFMKDLVLIITCTENMRYSFNPRTAESLGDLGTAYATTQVRDVWGILEVSDRALLVREERGHMAEVRVPVPSDTSGQTISAQDGLCS